MICSNCQSPREVGDAFCGQCGSKLGIRARSSTDFVPLPISQRRVRKTKRKSSKKPKRKLLRIFGSLALVVLILMSASTWFVLSRFDDVQTLSDVPERVHLAFEDSEGAVDIDTGPALQALNQPTQEPKNSLDPKSSVFRATLAQSASTPDAAEHRASVPELPGITVLLMGVDAEDSEHIDVGVRSDSLTVLHLDPESGTCRLLGVPTDARVDLPGYGLSKIDHALAVGGIPYQRLVVKQYLGIDIEHYGLVNFEGIVEVVDSVGGITVNNPIAFSDETEHFAEGEITLDGEQSLRFARYNGEPDDNVDRADRQQIVVRALISQLGGTDAVRAVPSFLRAAEGHVKTDLSAMQLVSFANQYRTTCTSSTLEARNLTGTTKTHPDPLMKADISYVILDPQDVEAGVRWLLTGEEETDLTD